MVSEKEFMHELYYKYYFDLVIPAKRSKLDVDKLEERFNELNTKHFNLKNLLDCDAYHVALYNISKSIVNISNKKLSTSQKQRVEKIKKEIVEDLNKLCDADIKYFHKKCEYINIIDMFSVPHTDYSIIRKGSIYFYYSNYYLPASIKNDIRKMMPSSPEDEYSDARNMKRHFVLHIGPTNSGKTYQALERLKTCEKGAYFGPLRLLALEVYDKFNWADVPCNMITGEEELLVDNAVCQASTIEMLNQNDWYDIVVVDEVQMISDPFRGHNWTKAILGLKANEIHLCMAPEAEDIVIKLIERCNDTYEIQRHERKTELIFDNKTIELKDVEQGDALIVFSKKSVLALATEMEKMGIKASVIYGNLPPETRRKQVELFSSGKTKVVISTDAIGMGLNLPIKRVIFVETYKFDGVQKRILNPPEIKQIAGRAGRMGLYEQGYVMAMSDKEYFENALFEPNTKIEHAYLGFAEDLLQLPFNLDELLKTWASLETPEIYRRMKIEEIMFMYNSFKSIRKNILSEYTKEEIYNLITCPVDIGNEEIIDLWKDYCKKYKSLAELNIPEFDADNSDLNELETFYKKLDLYFQFSRKNNLTIKTKELSEMKKETVNKINKILTENGLNFGRKCNRCGRALAFNYAYGICPKCYKKQQRRRWY